MGSKRKHILLFFFTALLFFRIADVHALSHVTDTDEDADHCELCEMINTTHQSAPVFTTASTDEAPKPLVMYLIQDTPCTYETSYYCITLPDKIYNKPPPRG